MPTSALLLQAVMVTAELCGHPFTNEGVADVFIDDLSGYPEPLILGALKRCRLEHKGRLTVADVLSRIEDGRPGVETAWAKVSELQDERKTGVWCEEMRSAWADCLPLRQSGDEVAARMAFKESYTRRLTEARTTAISPVWTVTPGSDPDHREQVVTEAATKGLITAEYATKLLPYHQSPTPDGQKLLEAAAPRLLPAPAEAPPAEPAPPGTVQERIAALRAAVTAKTWQPTPRPPRPTVPSDEEIERLLAEARDRYKPKQEEAAEEIMQKPPEGGSLAGCTNSRLFADVT